MNDRAVEPDKKELLKQLKIDRSEPEKGAGTRPLKWFVLIALVAGAGFVFWFFDIPGQGSLLSVSTAVAEATSQRNLDSGGSVLDATGYVVARRQATVSSKSTGKVLEVLIEEGVEVVKGQLLARLDDSIPLAQLKLAEAQLESSRTGLEELEVLLKQVQLDLQRTQELAQRNLASQADLDSDELSVEGLIARLNQARKEIVVAQYSAAVQRQVVEDMQIRAPFSGIVIAKAAQPGEMISPVSAGGGFTRTGICTIVDMDSLEIEVDINESYINRVYAGQPVEVTLNAYPDDRFAASVIAIIPAADRNKATVRVRVGFVEKDARVLPDMGVRVVFLAQEARVPEQTPLRGVTIPADAIVKNGAGHQVYVVVADQAQARAVVIADRRGATVRVIDGLQPGERVVDKLSDELLASLNQGTRITSINTTERP
ncbi:MAG: efflux RND transporter periplasmic adaptor subunit [Proteobacteria bacterium]|nr:efflux RND transporter periplasmic adaptor subunit [Pseudomonadota bacterium]